MNEEIELKNCPFCPKGKARVVEYPSLGDACVKCDSCEVEMYIEGDFCDSKKTDSTKEAIKAWNKRTPPQITDEMIERATRAAKRVLMMSEESDYTKFGREIAEATLKAALQEIKKK